MFSFENVLGFQRNEKVSTFFYAHKHAYGLRLYDIHDICYKGGHFSIDLPIGLLIKAAAAQLAVSFWNFTFLP